MKRNRLFPVSAAWVSTILIFILILGSGQLCGQTPAVKNILLIHGTFADGSGWEGVFRILNAKGYHVTVVQNPCSSFEEDVAAVKRAMDRETGPCILVGHSYGGADPSLPDLTDGGVLAPDASGLIYFDKSKFHAGFCADLPESQAEFMSAAQIPGAVKAFTAVVIEDAATSFH